MNVGNSDFVGSLVRCLVNHEKDLSLTYAFSLLNADVGNHSADLRTDFDSLHSADGGRISCCEYPVAELYLHCRIMAFFLWIFCAGILACRYGDATYYKRG